MAKDSAAEFLTALNGLAKRIGNRKVEIDTDDVRALVRNSAEGAREYVKAVCVLASSNPTLLGLGMNVAAAYAVEFNDLSLMKQVEETAKQIGREDMLEQAMSHMKPKSGTQRRSAPENSLRLMEVLPHDLTTCNIKPFTSLFSLERIKASGMTPRTKVLRGKCSIVFPLDDDPRPVIRIPSSRKFIQKLHKEIPYLPYFLTPIPEVGALHIYFGCLIDESSIIGEHAFDVSSQSFIPILLKCTEGIAALCDLIDDDTRIACNNAFAIFPKDLRDLIMLMMGIT